MFHSPLPFPTSLGLHPLPPLTGQGCKQMKSHNKHVLRKP